MGTTPKYRLRSRTTRIIIHDSHTHLPWGPAQIDEDTLKKGLITPGYHMVFPREGGRIAYRPIDCIGAHTPGHNDDSIGICWEGGRDDRGRAVENITLHQRKDMLRFCADMMDLYGKTLRVEGHSEVQRFRDLTAPKCPQMDMDLFRQDLEDYQRAGTYG